MAYEKESKSKSKTTPKTVALKARFESLHGKKSDLINRCEDYAMWTLPYLFPRSGHKDTEMQGSVDSTGARAVNYLSNKLIMTMFAPHQPFFRLVVALNIVRELQAEAKKGDQDAQAVLDGLDQSLADAEKAAMEELNYNKYRTEATMASKLLVVTGNALLYHPQNEKGKVQCYNVRDYCIVRDLSGTVIEIITRDKKALFTFSQEVIEALQASDSKYKKDTECDCTLYTQVKLEDDGKFHLKQAIEQVDLNSDGAWPLDDLPWIPLTWNLVRGEDYGRGLVEDYAGAFHALNILSNALIDVAGIAADIKFLVNPNSVVDVKALNDSESGTYHSGMPDDVAAVQVNKISDLQIVENTIDRYQKQIGTAFLLNSAVTRDAERVTAEEIRTVAQELELSHGGIYSRFAEEWQLRTAILLLKKVNVKVAGKAVYPQIITGLDSLSRAGDLDNLRLFIQDMSMLNEVPEVMQGAIDPLKFAAFIGVRRGVDYMKFMKSQEQMATEQQQAIAQQNAMDAAQQGNAAASAVAQEAGKAAVKGE